VERQKSSVWTLESALVDCFGAQILSNVKCRILRDISVLKSLTKLLHVPQNRDDKIVCGA